MADGITTSIYLTWKQPKGSAYAVDIHEVIYMYIVDECRRDGGDFTQGSVTVMVGSNSSLRSYTIINSSLTPVEEGSIYSITLIAKNNVTESRSDTIHTATHIAGTIAR